MGLAVDFVFLAGKAKEIIEANGKTVTLVKTSKGTLKDVAKPFRGYLPGSETLEVVKAIEDQFTLEEIDGTTIMKGDKQYHVAADSVSEAERPRLAEYESLRDGGETWRIVKVMPIEPGSIPVLYTFHASKVGIENA